MRRIVIAAPLLLVAFGVALGEDFRAVIHKVDGDKVTFTKQKKGEKGEEMTLTVAASAKILKGKFDKETKKLVAGEAIEGGLKNELFSKGKVPARITTSDDGKSITQIVVGGRGKGKKKKNNTD
ncbi:MAG: hypothetical protein FJ271_21300 [Planctomycetes bacterium]|nr:hypothetical protein [Planctomycetota bacterium]